MFETRQKLPVGYEGGKKLFWGYIYILLFFSYCYSLFIFLITIFFSILYFLFVIIILGVL